MSDQLNVLFESFLLRRETSTTVTVKEGEDMLTTAKKTTWLTHLKYTLEATLLQAGSAVEMAPGPNVVIGAYLT